MKKIVFGIVLGIALAIVISRYGPNVLEQSPIKEKLESKIATAKQNTLERCPFKEQLESKITKAKQTVEAFRKGHVIVGQVVLDGEGDVRDVQAQMEILTEGYFAGPVKDLFRPISFRMHQYAPYDLQLKGIKKDTGKDLIDVGTIHMKQLDINKLLDFKAQVALNEGDDLSQATIQLSVIDGPVNTPSNGTEPRSYWPESIKIPVQENGLAQASGFSPIGYWCIIKAPDYLDKSFKIEFREGQALDLGTITLEKPGQIELSYIVSKEPPFAPDDLKTVKIPAGTRWKALDDIYGWDLEFKQDKGLITMNYSYAPCYLWDLGTCQIGQYASTTENQLGQRLPYNPQAINGHVYLVNQAHWERWILLKVFTVIP